MIQDFASDQFWIIRQRIQRERNRKGLHYLGGTIGSAHADYFHLRLDEHLSFLVARSFLTAKQRDDIVSEIENHRSLLQLASGCLVHKDLALWNVLGTRDHIAAFIDFDDAISGDPMDDLSLIRKGSYHVAA